MQMFQLIRALNCSLIHASILHFSHGLLLIQEQEHSYKRPNNTGCTASFWTCNGSNLCLILQGIMHSVATTDCYRGSLCSYWRGTLPLTCGPHGKNKWNWTRGPANPNSTGCTGGFEVLSTGAILTLFEFVWTVVKQRHRLEGTGVTGGCESI